MTHQLRARSPRESPSASPGAIDMRPPSAASHHDRVVARRLGGGHHGGLRDSPSARRARLPVVALPGDLARRGACRSLGLLPVGVVFRGAVGRRWPPTDPVAVRGAAVIRAPTITGDHPIRCKVAFLAASRRSPPTTMEGVQHTAIVGNVARIGVAAHVRLMVDAGLRWNRSLVGPLHMGVLRRFVGFQTNGHFRANCLMAKRCWDLKQNGCTCLACVRGGVRWEP